MPSSLSSRASITSLERQNSGASTTSAKITSRKNSGFFNRFIFLNLFNLCKPQKNTPNILTPDNLQKLNGLDVKAIGDQSHKDGSDGSNPSDRIKTGIDHDHSDTNSNSNSHSEDEQSKSSKSEANQTKNRNLLQRKIFGDFSNINANFNTLKLPNNITKNNLKNNLKNDLKNDLKIDAIADLGTEEGQKQSETRKRFLKKFADTHAKWQGIREKSGIAAWYQRHRYENQMGKYMTYAFHPIELIDKNSTEQEILAAKKHRRHRLKNEGIKGLFGSQDVTLRLWLVGLLSPITTVPGLGTLVNAGMLLTIDPMVLSLINAQQEVCTEGVGAPDVCSFSRDTMNTRTKKMQVLEALFKGIAELDTSNFTTQKKQDLADYTTKLIKQQQQLSQDYKGARGRFSSLLAGQREQNIVRTAWIPLIGVLSVFKLPIRIDTFIRSIAQSIGAWFGGQRQAKYKRMLHGKLPGNILKEDLSNKGLANALQKNTYQEVLEFVKNPDSSINNINNKIIYKDVSDLFDQNKIEQQNNQEGNARLSAINTLITEELASVKKYTQDQLQKIQSLEQGQSKLQKQGKLTPALDEKYRNKIALCKDKIKNQQTIQIDLRKQLGLLAAIMSRKQDIFKNAQALRDARFALNDLNDLNNTDNLEQKENLKKNLEEKINFLETQIITSNNYLLEIENTINQEAAKAKEINQQRGFKPLGTKTKKTNYLLHELLHANAAQLTWRMGKINLQRPNDFAPNFFVLGFTGMAFTGLFAAEALSTADIFSRLDSVTAKLDILPSGNPADSLIKNALSNVLLMSFFVPEFMYNVAISFELMIKFGNNPYFKDYAEIIIEKLKQDLQLATIYKARINSKINKINDKLNNKDIEKYQIKKNALLKKLETIKTQEKQMQALIEGLYAQIQHPDSLAKVLVLKPNNTENTGNIDKNKALTAWCANALNGLAVPLKADHIGRKHENQAVEQVAHLNQTSYLKGLESLESLDDSERSKGLNTKLSLKQGFWKTLRAAKERTGHILGRHFGSKTAQAKYSSKTADYQKTLDLITNPNQDPAFEKMMNQLASKPNATEADFENFWQEMLIKIPAENDACKRLFINRLKQLDRLFQSILNKNNNKNNNINNEVFLKNLHQGLKSFLAQSELATYKIGMETEVEILYTDGQKTQKIKKNGQILTQSLTSTAAYYATQNYRGTEIQPINLSLAGQVRAWLRSNVYHRRFGIRASYHFITKRLIRSFISSISAIAVAIIHRRIEKDQKNKLEISMGQAMQSLKTKSIATYLAPEINFYTKAYLPA